MVRTLTTSVPTTQVLNPYAKILREYRVCEPDRYLSTYHERDQETGYDNRGARLYDSEIGRFFGVDPLADHPNQIDKSPYQYVWGNPVSLTDPDGKCPWCVGVVIGGGVELVSQIGVNLAQGKDPFDIDWYDVGQSTLTGALTAGIGTVANSLKAANTARVVLLVVDEAAKAGTDIRIENGEVEVSSVANGSKDTKEAGVQFAVGVAVGVPGEIVGDVASDIVNQGLKQEVKAATRQARRTRTGSANNIAARTAIDRGRSAMEYHRFRANAASTVIIDQVKPTFESWLFQGNQN